MNIFKKTLMELLVVLGVLVVLVMILNYFSQEEGETVKIVEAQLAGQEITLEVADNIVLQRRGLSGRVDLEEDRGMIFVYEGEMEGLTFWMKDTLIPLDMLFLNKDYEVVYIIENVPICEEDPCPTYESEENAQYVVELNAGWVERYGVKVGDSLKFKNLDQSDS